MASIRKRGNSWSVEIRKVGFESVRRTFSHRSDAKTWAAETEAEMDRGTYLSNREYLRVTFREALERYEREISSQKKSGETELSRLHRWQRHPLASRFLGALRSVDFAQFRDQRQAEGKSSNTIRLELALVSHLFNVARKEWGYEGLTNPIENIRLPKPSRARDRRLVGDEAQRLMAALENSRNSLILPLVQFAIETGARQGEILKLEWRNVDIESSTMRLLDTKNGDDRWVPLSTRAKAILAALPRSDASRVFDCTPSAVVQAFERACDRANIANLRFHDLRHEATSRFFEKGLDTMSVASITGHKSLQMLRRYTHLRATDLAKFLG